MNLRRDPAPARETTLPALRRNATPPESARCPTSTNRSSGSPPTGSPNRRGSFTADGVAEGRLERVVGVSLVLLALVVARIWAAAVPFSYAPDEPYHFQIVDFLVREGRLPVFGPNADMWVWRTEDGKPIESYALYPPAAYLLDAAVVALKPAGLTDGEAARWPSAVLVALTVLFVWLTARQLYPGSPVMRLGPPAFVAALPSHAHLGAYVNVDALTTAASAAVWWLLISGSRHGWRWSRVLALGVLLGVVLLSKYNAYLLVPVALLTLAASARNTVGVGGSIARCLASTIGAAAVAGPWFARNWALYGEPLPERVLRRAFNTIAPDYPYSLLDRGAGPFYLTWPDDWWLSLHMSFWGTFGFASVPLPDPAYTAGLLVLVVAVAGPVCRRRSLPAIDPSARWPLLAMAVGLAAVVGQTYLASWVRDYQPQARYLFPTLTPIALAVVAGLLAWWPRSWRLGPRARRIGAAALPVPLLLLNLAALDASVGAAFHGLEPATLTLRIDTPSPAAVVNEDRLRVGGWATRAGEAPWSLALAFAARPYFEPVPVVLYAVTADRAAPTPLGPAVPAERPDLRQHFGNDAALAGLGFEAAVPVERLGAGPVTLLACPADFAPGPRCAEVEITVPDRGQAAGTPADRADRPGG